jgi:hypothetical protein
VNAPNAETAEILFIVTERDKSLNVDIELVSLFPTDIQSVKFIVGKEKMDMTKEADGSYSINTKATADTLAYQLELDAAGHTHNGTQSDYFIYDGGGDFYSVLRVKAGSDVKITFNPKKTIRASKGALPKVKWDSPFLTKFSELSTRIDNERRNAIGSYVKAQSSGQPFTNYDYGSLKTELETIANDVSEKLELRQFSAIKRMSLLFDSPDPKVTEGLLKLVPPSSMMWGVDPYALGTIANSLYVTDFMKQIDFLEPYKNLNPDRNVRALTLSSMGGILLYINNKELLDTTGRAVYNELKEKYGDMPEVQFTLKRLNPDRAIAVGRQVPDFEIKLLSGETVSRQSMMGKFYLIDFWAVWCGPCVGEMPLARRH